MMSTGCGMYLFPALLIHGERGMLAVEVGQQLLGGAGGRRAHAPHHAHVLVGVCVAYGLD